MEESTRILGVDDSLTIRKALELVLKPAGYNLELVGSGAEALDKAREFRPAVLLLDFILPDMRGTEVCKKLASDPRTARIPVVLISAKGAEIRQAYEDVGNVVSYITKPFTPEDVTGVVEEVLSRVEAGAVQEEAVVPTVPAGQEKAGEPWEEGEEIELAPVPRTVRPHEAIEGMFETLRASLEGVYVEESETTAGAAADEARSYTDLVSRLGRQLGETLNQARSGVRFALSSDGSVRSLDENLLDGYRRFCRVLFRAVTAGAVGEESRRDRARVLVVGQRGSGTVGTLRRVLSRSEGLHGVFICERFRQLPIMTRLYGPTHVLVEMPRSGGALLDQARRLAAMPERKRFHLIGIGHADLGMDDPMVQELQADGILRLGPGFVEAFLDMVRSRRETSRTAVASSVAAAL